MERESREDTCLLVCGGNRGNREVYPLFMRLLLVDTLASVVVVSEQILRDRVWQVRQPCFTAGTLFFAPMLITFSLQDSMATAHNSLN